MNSAHRHFKFKIKTLLWFLAVKLLPNKAHWHRQTEQQVAVSNQ